MAVKLTGLDRLNRKLQRLPARAEREIRIAMEKGAEEVVTLAKSLAPIGPSSGVKGSNNPGALRDSIGWVWGGKAPRGSVSLGSISRPNGFGDNDLRITIFAGNDEAFYARWVEFGTKPHTISAKNSPTMSRAGVNFGTSVSHPGISKNAHAFFFPAYRAMRKRIRSRISRAITKSVRDVANS